MMDLTHFFDNVTYPDTDEPIGIYIHVPFCKNRCNYCDFVSTIYDEENMAKYTTAVKREFEWYLKNPEFNKRFRNASIDTLYFGGGTPSIMNEGFFEEILELCHATFNFLPHVETTVEINPDSITLPKLKALHNLGINRASLGAQSFNNLELQAMNRIHTEKDIHRAVSFIREAGFTNLSIDLIIGYPGQTTKSITDNIKKLLYLKPEHTSIYRLDLKEGSPLHHQIEAGEVPPLDEQFIDNYYEHICEMMEAQGYERYETSSFARPRFACQHNLKFWKDRIFLGFGAGAQGMTGTRRYANLANLESYFDSVDCGMAPYASYKKMTPQTRFKVALIMGSYLVEGVNLNQLGQRYNVNAVGFIKDTVGKLLEEGIIEISSNNIFKINPSGRDDYNKVFAKWA